MLSLLLASTAHAECSIEIYRVSGIVNSAADSSPVAGAKVVVIYNQPGYAAPDSKASGVVLSVAAQTDQNGRYQLDVNFDPLSANGPGTEACKNKLAFVTVSVSAVGFELLLQEQQLSGAASTANYSLKRTAAERLR
jgi:hypothetical protein